MSDGKTQFAHAWVEGSGNTQCTDEHAPVPVVCGGETFASQWHLDNYVNDLRRIVAADLERAGLSEERRAALDAERQWALGELDRLGAK